MTNTRINHTGCSHDSTPAGRAWCRATRKDAIRKAQAAYMVNATSIETPTRAMYDEYYALVELASYRLGVELDEAYRIVENGPVVY